MAKTTSKSTKAKTKTSKKPVAAKAEKPVAKTVKASQETKEVKVESVTPKKVVAEAKMKRAKRAISATTIGKWHRLSGLLFAVAAVVAAAVMNTDTLQVSVGHLAADELISIDNTVFAPAQHMLYDLQVRWLVVGVMGLSAIFSLLRGTRLWATEKAGLERRILPWRWVDMAITGALMLETVALLTGAQDIVTLKLFGALFAASAVFAWLAERENAGAARFVKGSYMASVVTGVLVLWGLSAYLDATLIYGAVRAQWYVYALSGLALLSLAYGAYVQSKAYRHVNNWSNYLRVERAYLLNNLLTKLAFAAILIVGLHS